MENNVRTLITFIPYHEDEDPMNGLDNALEEITENFDLVTDIFVYEKDDKRRSVFVTFRANIPENQHESPIENTRFINRNPRTNTFYTINALNRICLKEIGEMDHNYRVQWQNYRNKLIILRNNKDGRKELVETRIKLIGRFNAVSQPDTRPYHDLRDGNSQYTLQEAKNE